MVGLPSYAPRVVRDLFAGWDRACLRVYGRPDRTSYRKAIARFDMNGDGLKDWIVNDGGVVCKGALTFIVGNSRFSVRIYLRRPDGSAYLAFDQAMQGVYRHESANGPAIYLGMRGRHCGQRVTATTPNSDLIGCLRPLRWNARRRQIEFGPVGESLKSDAGIECLTACIRSRPISGLRRSAA